MLLTHSDVTTTRKRVSTMWQYQYTDELYHWKYVKKIKQNGKWRYYYDIDSFKKDVGDKIDSVWNNPDNIYDVNANNYSEKIEAIKNSKEWKDIVARNDPEYVLENADGTKTYLLDDYLVKKKHPKIDIMDDIANGRNISVNKITVNSFVAGTKDEVNKAKRRIKLITKAVTGIFKLAQGSYNDELREAKKTVDTTLKNAANSAKNTATNAAYKTARNTVTTSINKNSDSAILKAATDPQVARTVKAGADFVTYMLRN